MSEKEERDATLKMVASQCDAASEFINEMLQDEDKMTQPNIIFAMTVGAILRTSVNAFRSDSPELINFFLIAMQSLSETVERTVARLEEQKAPEEEGPPSPPTPPNVN